MAKNKHHIKKRMTSRAFRLRTLKARQAQKALSDVAPPESSSTFIMDEASEAVMELSQEETAKSNEKRRQKFRIRDARGNCTDGETSRKIVSDDCILQLCNVTSVHAKNCSDSSFTSLRLVNGNLEVDCSKCCTTFVASQDLGIQTPLDKALTLSVFASGTGFEALNTILNVMQVPLFTLYKYQNQEEIIFREMWTAKEEEFVNNAKEEARLAIDRGDFVISSGKRIPFITVVVDGGWSKRSYGHNYDSKSGVAVIIGAYTKKILFMNWRISTCSQCSANERLGRKKEHRCFRNWNDSPQAMEADIIVEGFQKSMSEHGIMYRYMVGDADSSVFYRVRNSVRYPEGIQVEKIDCINHAIRCIRSKLYGIAKMTALDKENRDTALSKIPQMMKDVYGAIAHNHQLQLENEQNSPCPSKLLSDDLNNIPNHVFGDHTRCKAYFCTKFLGIRTDTHLIGTPTYNLVCKAFNVMAQKSSRIIHNVTSNLAENFMSQMSKFTSGKRCNQSQRYGYPLRCMSAMFAFNMGAFWPATMYKKYHNITNVRWENHQARSLLIRQNARKRVQTRFLSKQKPKKRALPEYGEESVDVDIDPEIMQTCVANHIQKLQVTPSQAELIQQTTIGQSLNENWRWERRTRITASNAGAIFKMRDQTNNSNIVKAILYPKDLHLNENIRRGIDYEPLARRKYEEETGNTVTECGLFVYVPDGIFGASPDGLIDEDGILEIKCTNVRPADLLKRADHILILSKQSETGMMLNRKHKYFFQVVMQLYVTGRQYCDFVVFFKDGNGEEELWTERVQRDAETDDLWQKMREKLRKFYTEDLGPEIVNARFPHLPIRQPAYREQAALRANEVKLAKRVRRETEEEVAEAIPA